MDTKIQDNPPRNIIKNKQTKDKQIIKKKIKAMELINKRGYNKSEACREVGINRLTLDKYINDNINGYKQLLPDKRISYWESESLKDSQLSSIVRNKLIEDILTNKVESYDTKRAIMHSASVVAGIKWDKAHPPKQQAQIEVNNVFALIQSAHRSLFPAASTQDVVSEGDKSVIEYDKGNNP